MGEAKVKEAARREHASRIVDAFEAHISAMMRSYVPHGIYGTPIHMELLEKSRAELIRMLVTPPPKP